MMNYRTMMSAFAALAAVTLTLGCQETTSTESATQPASGTAASDHGHEHGEAAHEHGEAGHDHSEPGHSHGAGPHDGTIADWGGGKYHVEFTVDHERQEATVYVLGSDEKSPAPIRTDKVTLIIGDPQMEVDLLPVPLEGESGGLASRFVGRHEKLAIVQEYAGTLSAEIEATPYTGDFKEVAHDHE